MSQLTDNLSLIQSCKEDIKSAIEAKGVDMTGVSFPGYAAAIGSISGGGGANLSSLSVTLNGTYTPDQGYDGFNTVHVSVAGGATLSSLSVSSNGTYTPETGYDGFSTVIVSIPKYYNDTDVAERHTNVSRFVDPTISWVGDYLYQGVSRSYYNYDIGTYEFVPIQPVMTYLQLDNCLFVNAGAFRSCWYLESVSLSVCKVFQTSAFDDCSALSSVTLGDCYTIGNYGFRGCGKKYNHFELHLTFSDHFCVLITKNALPSYALVYVPSDVYAQYTADAVWSNFTIISV